MSLSAIRHRIEAACRAAGRDADSVTLAAVSKNRTAADIAPLVAAGQKTFAENRVQEAAAKWPALRAAHPDIRLHFIGHLQSNKAGDAVALFDVIESVDRASLADALRHEMDRQNRNLPCYIQVNTGEEPQKGGVAPADLAGLLAHCRDAARLDIRGLMCIPPADEIPDMHFALLHKYARALGLPVLSMGMSSDFDTAIRYGATEIRVGTALFAADTPAA